MSERVNFTAHGAASAASACMASGVLYVRYILCTEKQGEHERVRREREGKASQREGENAWVDWKRLDVGASVRGETRGRTLRRVLSTRRENHPIMCARVSRVRALVCNLSMFYTGWLRADISFVPRGERRLVEKHRKFESKIWLHTHARARARVREKLKQMNKAFLSCIIAYKKMHFYRITYLFVFSRLFVAGHGRTEKQTVRNTGKNAENKNRKDSYFSKSSLLM